MQGLGNDFVIIDNREELFKLNADNIKHIADRKFGVGCDQLIMIENSSKADIAIEIYNQDGSLAEACGNGTRCIASIIMNETKLDKVSIKTASTITHAKICQNGEIAVNMGIAKTNWQEIPLIHEMDSSSIDIAIDNIKNPFAVNVGNPHLVFFVEDLTQIEIEEIGPTIENHYYFPKKINVNFAQIIDQNTIKIITFERGVGLTLACGTGACASVFAAIEKKLTNNQVRVLQKGGDLLITKNQDGSLEMQGEVALSFTGRIKI